MTTVVALEERLRLKGVKDRPRWVERRPHPAIVYRRRRALVLLLVALIVFCIALVGSEMLGRFSGTAGSTPVGSVEHQLVYVVQPGDTLWEIAHRLNPPDRDVREVVDHLADSVGTTVLQPGQRIVLSLPR